VTTPNQDAPDGAVTVGGGAWNFGQLVNEKTSRAAFEIEPPSNLVEALELLPVVMGQLPTDAMKPWQKWLNMSDQQRASGEVLQEFLDSLEDNVLVKTIDGMVRGLVGWVETGYTPAQVEAAARDLAQTLADLRSVVTALLASTGYAGVARVIDFNGRADASSLGPEWSQSYWGTGDGTLGVSAGRARWIGSATERWGFATYVDAETKSDFQKVGCAFATAPSRDIFGGSRSVNRIMARCSDDLSSFIALDLRADSWTLGCQVGWSWTTWHSRNSTLFDPWQFKPGASYWLEAGTSGGARIYRVWENNKVLHTHVESSALSNLGAGFRKVGVSVMAFSATQLPAQMAAFAFYDNQSAEKRGSGWRIARTGSGTSDMSNGDNSFPSNWFDTPEYITDDLIYDTTNNKITVAATGWYEINVCQHGDSPIIGAYSTKALLVVNGGTAQRGATCHWNGQNVGFSGSFVVYLEEGDEVKPGYRSSSALVSQLGGGDAAGLNTYWSGVYLGTNKKLPTEEA